MNADPQSSPSTISAAADAAALQLNVDTLSQVSNGGQGESFLDGMGAMDFSYTSSERGGADGAAAFSIEGDKVMGLNLVLLRNYSNVCGGEVGCAGCGCVADKGSCATIKHLRSKVTWPSEPSLFFRGRMGSVYLEPSLPLKAIAESDVASVLQAAHTIESWAEEVASYGYAQKSGTTVYDAQYNLKGAKEIFKTPARDNKRRVVFTSSLAEVQKSSGKAPRLDPIVPAMEEKIAELTAVKGSGDGNTQLEVADALVLFMDLARRVDNQATAEGARDELVSASSEYFKSEVCDINLMLGALEGEVSVLKALIGKRPTEMETDGNLFEIVSTFETILKLSGAEEAAVSKLPLASRTWLGSVLLPYKKAIDVLATRVTGLENGVVGGQGGADAMPPQLHRAPRPSSTVTVQSRDTTWERNIEAQLASLTRQVAGNINPGDKRVNFGGQTFANKNEMQAWLELKEGKSNFPFSSFQCHVTFLHRVHTHLTGGRRELRDVKYMSDLKIRDHCVNAAQAFSSGGLPLIFKGDKNTPIFTGLDTGGPKARFPNIPTFARFGETNDHDAMRHKILTAMSEVHKTMQHDIEADLVNPEARSLASKMAMRTLEFCQALIQFLSDTYRDYLSSFGCETKTWDFVCLCVEKVLTSEFAEARSLVCGLDLGQPSFSAKIIWGSMRIVCVQERFLEVGISNHPILSSTCSRYLIKNSGLGDGDEAKKMAVKNDVKITALEATIADLKSQVKSATSLADKANNALKKVSTDLAKLSGSKK